MARVRFGRMQLQILCILWERGEIAARDITDALSRQKAVAHSTVQTLLRQLEVKGAVAHRKQDRAFLFYAKVKPENVKRTAIRDVINRLFDGSPAGLVAHLLQEERISPKELDGIRKLIDDEEKRS
jgi:BlaI family transcriptional regulator, penicillinase repressor